MRKSKGFTLVELITVIAIIGVLSLIAIASYAGVRAKARDTKRISDISQIRVALAYYLDKNGAYPSSLGSISPTYIQSLPTDPFNKTTGTPAVNYTYGYALLSSGSYCLGATLENVKDDYTNNVPPAFCTGSNVTNNASNNYIVGK